MLVSAQLEEHGDLLAIGKQSNDVEDVGPLHVQPAAGKAVHPDAANLWNADQLTDPR